MEASCGNQCGHDLPCGHPCPKKCHGGPCVTENQRKTCNQPCGEELSCGHRCQAKCHGDKPCGPCTTTVEISCECGVSNKRITCKEFSKRMQELETKFRKSPKHPGKETSAENEDEEKPPAAASTAEVPETDVATEDAEEKKAPIPISEAKNDYELREMITFPCTDDCVYQRRLSALASVGGGSGKSSPGGRKTIYSIRIWGLAKKDVDSVLGIEKQLAAFLSSSDQSVMLPNMAKEKRILVHEMCWYYHISCEAVDREPHRSCFLTKTMKTSAPHPLLSSAVYDDKQNPNFIAPAILKSPQDAHQKVIVLEGSNVNEIAIHGYLKNYAGQFIIVPHEEKETTFFLVFPSPLDMTNAFSFLRRQGIPSISFRRYGEEPPPTQSGGMLNRSPPPQATPAGGAKGGSGGKGGAGGKTWAQMINQQQKKQEKKSSSHKDPLETNNKFSALF